MHNKDFLNRCPICGEEFKIGNYDIFTLNKKLDKDITYNDVLDEAEEQQFDEDEYPYLLKMILRIMKLEIIYHYQNIL